MTPPRIFRLFVSSTFSDFIEERERLKEKVFPDLEKYCARKGARFQAVDLRWGITEAAQQNNETIQICLEEVRRCQDLSPRPNFAVLLGHRYGWEPIPEIIPEAHWGRLVAELIAQGETGDIRTLNDFYQSDTNAVPPVYCLAPAVTDEQTSNVQRIFRRAAAHFTGNDRLPYFGSATHQEIALGALGINDADEHVHAYIRRIKNLPNDSRAKGYIDLKNNQRVPGANQRLNQLETELRKRLAEDHAHEFECTWIKEDINERNDSDDENDTKKSPPITLDHLQSFGDSFYRHQVALIDQELARIEKTESLQTPNKKHRTFAEERTEFFVGRDSTLNQIADYLHPSSTPQSPFIAVAEGGSGKSSIIAKSYLQAFEGSASNRDPVVLCRFIGGVAGVENLKSLLDSLISETHRAFGFDGTTAFQTVKEAGLAFKEALKNASQEHPLWIFIDALDQLERADNLPLSDWLPETLPESVRIILSARPEALASSQGFTPHQIAPMPGQEGEELLNRWLKSSRDARFSAGITPTSGRTLTREQRALVLEPFANHGNPLWLKLAYEDARHWRSWHQPNKELKALPRTVAGMVKKFLETYLIEQRKHPPVFVRKALSYLTAGRYGLSEEEIGLALGTDQEVRDEFKDLEKTDQKWSCGKSLPPIFWSRLAFDLKPYLTSAFIDGALVYRYFHREFTAAIEKNFSDGRQKADLHAHLAKEVFSQPVANNLYQDTDASKETQVSQAMRRIMEQPWQLASAKQGEQLGKLLTDFSFCMAKCAANRSNDLLNDYQLLETNGVPENTQSRAFRRFFTGLSMPTLSKGNIVWPAHRILMQLALEHADDSPISEAAERFRNSHTIDWHIAHLSKRPKQEVLNPCEAILVDNEHTSPIENVISNGKNQLFTFHSDRSLKIWDIKVQKPIAHFHGIALFSCLSTGIPFYVDNKGAVYTLENDTFLLSGTIEKAGLSTDFQRLDDDAFSYIKDGSAFIFYPENITQLERIRVPYRKISKLKKMQDGNLLLLLDFQTLAIFDQNSKNVTHEFETRNTSEGFGEIDDYVYSYAGQEIEVWSKETQKKVHHIEAKYSLSDVAPFSKQNIYYTGLINLYDIKETCIIDLSSGIEQTLTDSNAPESEHVFYASDENTFVADNGDDTTIFDGNGAETHNFIVKNKSSRAFTPDPDSIFYLANKKIVCLDRMSCKLLGELVGHKEDVAGIYFGKHRKIVSWDADNEIRVWDRNQISVSGHIPGHASNIESINSFDNGNLLSYSHDSKAIIWRGNDLEPITDGYFKNIGTIQRVPSEDSFGFDIWIANEETIEFRGSQSGSLIKEIKTPSGFLSLPEEYRPTFINGFGLCTSLLSNFSWINLHNFQLNQIYFHPDVYQMDYVKRLKNDTSVFVYSIDDVSIPNNRKIYKELSIRCGSYSEIFTQEFSDVTIDTFEDLVIYHFSGATINIVKTSTDHVHHEVFKNHEGTISGFNILQNKLIVSWDEIGEIKLWCPVSLRELFTYSTNNRKIIKVEFYESAVASVLTKSGTVIVIDLRSGKELSNVELEQNDIEHLIFINENQVSTLTKSGDLTIIGVLENEKLGQKHVDLPSPYSISTLNNKYLMVTSKSAISVYFHKEKELKIKYKILTNSTFGSKLLNSNYGQLIFSGTPEIYPSFIEFED